MTWRGLTSMLMPGSTASCGAGQPSPACWLPPRCSSTCSEAGGCSCSCCPVGGWNSGGCTAASRTTDCSSCVRILSCAKVACAAGLQDKTLASASAPPSVYQLTLHPASFADLRTCLAVVHMNQGEGWSIVGL